MKTEKINQTAKKAGIPTKFFQPLGDYKGKVDLKLVKDLQKKKDGKLILVTAITPTKFGEGKTTVSIALADSINIENKCLLCLREPSMGPTFGVKGGATGFGASSLFLQDDINLHFTGDFHAINSVTNLVAAVIDNHIFQGNELDIDPNRITWKRSLDVNDRSLRDITTCQAINCGEEKKAKFVITAASELMVSLVLAKSKESLLEKIANTIVAYTKKGKPVQIKDFKIEGAISALLEEAIKPNLTTTVMNSPTFIHGGPFANIATGNSSVIATRLSRKLSPITITEAGFGADLGAQKFLDIVCREGEFQPDLVILVGTIKALKHHGGCPDEKITNCCTKCLREGFANLVFHYNNLKAYGLPVLVVLNQFSQDHPEEVKEFFKLCQENKLEYSLVEPAVFKKQQRILLANKTFEMLKRPKKFKQLYKMDESAWDKIEKVCKGTYHCKNIEYSLEAKKTISAIIKEKKVPFHVCISKVPTAIGDDPNVLNVPQNHTIHIREAYFNSGANLLVCLTGKIVDLPGLPKVPRAVNFVKK